MGSSEAQSANTATTTDTTVTTEVTPNVSLGPDGKPLDPARAAKAIEGIKPLKERNSELEALVADLQGKVKEHEDAKLSETEKLSNRVSELEAERSAWERERQELRVGMLIEQAAVKAGAVHPEAIPRLVELADVQYDKDGTPKNIDKLIEQTRTQYPSLFGTQRGTFDGGVRGTTTQQTPDEIFGAILRGEHVT